MLSMYWERISVVHARVLVSQCIFFCQINKVLILRMDYWFPNTHSFCSIFCGDDNFMYIRVFFFLAY